MCLLSVTNWVCSLGLFASYPLRISCTNKAVIKEYSIIKSHNEKKKRERDFTSLISKYFASLHPGWDVASLPLVFWQSNTTKNLLSYSNSSQLHCATGNSEIMHLLSYSRLVNLCPDLADTLKAVVNRFLLFYIL